MSKRSVLHRAVRTFLRSPPVPVRPPSFDDLVQDEDDKPSIASQIEKVIIKRSRTERD